MRTRLQKPSPALALALSLALAFALIGPLGAGRVQAAGLDTGPAPGNLRATAGSAWVRLDWNAPASPPGPVLGYAIYRSGLRLDTVLAGDPSYVDYRVTSGQSYSYAVTALYDGKVEGPASAPAGATPRLANLRLILPLGETTALVNDARMILDAPASLVGGSTMVPLRFVGTVLGATFGYDAGSKRVTATLGGRTVHLVVGQTRAEIDGKAVTITAPPILKNGHTLVPVRFLAEAFGARVAYDAPGERVVVTLDDSDATPAAATSLATGVPCTGVLSGPADIDFFRLAATPGRTYRIRAGSLAAGVDPVLALVAPAAGTGESVVTAASGSQPPWNRSAELEVLAGPGDTALCFRVQAAAGSAGAGAYTIAADDVTEPQDTPSGATSLVVGAASPAAGTLHTPTDLDYWSFRAEAGQAYAIYVRRATPNGESGAGQASLPLEFHVALSSAGGGPVIMRNDLPEGYGAPTPGYSEPNAATPGSEPRLLWSCLDSGDYLVGVSSLNGATGPYTVEVRQVSLEAHDSFIRAIQVVADRDAVSNWLTAPDQETWYAFVTARGQRYYVQTFDPSAGCDTRLTLFAYDGRELASSDDAPGVGRPLGGSRLSWVATYDGMLYVRVAAQASGGTATGAEAPAAGAPGDGTIGAGPAGSPSTGLGRYSFAVSTVAPETSDLPTLAEDLSAGGAALTRSLVTGDRDWFRLTVSRGGVYTVETRNLGGGADTDLAIYDGDWHLVAANDDVAPGRPASRVTFTAEASGAVYVCVSPVFQNAYADGTGTYDIAAYAGAYAGSAAVGG